jgi:hypothetical protein
VQTTPSGLATTGVIALIGESNQGPDFTLEQDLQLNAFGPDSFASVAAKYGSGPLVDGFRAMCAPSKDPGITGAPQAIIIVKTNVSGKASGALPKIGGGTYATILDKSQGALGNQIYWQTLSNVAEVVPTTSAFTYIPPVGGVNAALRVNGGASETFTVTANMTPASFQGLVGALSGITAVGGVDRVILAVSGTLALAIVGVPGTSRTVTVTRSVAWAASPVIGDTLTIPHGSVLQDDGVHADCNVGAYVITAVSTSTLTAIKLSDAGSTNSPVAGTVTAPRAVAATPIAALTDAKAWSPVSISLTSASVIDGVGKSLEIADLGTGGDQLIRTAYLLGTNTQVSWVSLTGAPAQLVSGAEYQIKLNVNRQSTATSESLVAGGRVALKMGYKGTSCTVTISATQLVTTASVSADSLTINFSDFPTVAALASFINAQPNYVASVGTAVLGQRPSADLDRVSAANASTQWGVGALRVKVDASDLFNVISQQSVLLQENSPAARADAGLPDVTSGPSFLTGGSKGGTSNAQVQAALDALQSAQLNFVVPAFSRDASQDIANGVTDPSSTYTIDSINTATLNHVLLMSETKFGRNRQSFLSKDTSFALAQAAAADLASFRASLCFLDMKQTDSQGNLVQFPSWMGAALAAGMQAAGFYKAIVNKQINTSGVLMADGSYNPRNRDQITQALQAGLLPAQPAAGGGFTWVSDQTTYGKDNNFVFNSIQAVYAADVVSVTTAQQMNAQFVGQSLADINAKVAESAIENIMANFLRLKLIAPSDDAPRGFRNVVIKIAAPAMFVSLQIKLATALYFIDISFVVAPVQQTATGQ